MTQTLKNWLSTLINNLTTVSEERFPVQPSSASCHLVTRTINQVLRAKAEATS